jgi:hypothetical protein
LYEVQFLLNLFYLVALPLKRQCYEGLAKSSVYIK